MHPALSVIFFTTLSGAGYGLLAWIGLSMALIVLPAPMPWALRNLLLVGIAIGLMLSTIGLLCSLAHLGQPQRAWRALSQWRTSWLSREGVVALLAPLPALAIGAVLLWAPPAAQQPSLLIGLGLLMAALSLATVACTAMIYASLKPIPAWRHPMVVPVYLLFALFTGFGLLLVLMAALWDGLSPAPLLPVLSLLGMALLGLKWLYWRDIDKNVLPATPADALGLPGREATVFERPHTEASYITREMAFTLARTHARWLRLAVSFAVLGLPSLALILSSTGLADPLDALVLAATGALVGAFIERWLFFAEARHMVTLYY